MNQNRIHFPEHLQEVTDQQPRESKEEKRKRGDEDEEEDVCAQFRCSSMDREGGGIGHIYFLLTFVAWMFVTECIVWNRVSCQVSCLVETSRCDCACACRNVAVCVCLRLPVCVCVLCAPVLAWLHACEYMRMYVPVRTPAHRAWRQQQQHQPARS